LQSAWGPRGRIDQQIVERAALHEARPIRKRLAQMETVTLDRQDRVLHVRFERRQRMLSHAVLGPGFVESDAVAWCQVDDRDLAPPVDPADFLAARLRTAGVPGAVGLLTGADVAEFVDVQRAVGRLSVRTVATVGLDNARRAGDDWDVAPPAVGTINVLVRASLPLADAALIEMLTVASEARAMAVLEGGVASRKSGRPATGTGTDCTVVAAPCGAAVTAYAGKHTALGHLVGVTVAEAIGRGVARWLERHPSRRWAGAPA
jgi:adenosylcobinamide amidohydrolase